MNIRISPGFFQAALDQQKPIRTALNKLIQQLAKLSYAEVSKHPGMHLEKLWGLVDPESGLPLYSIRISRSARALAIFADATLTLLAIHTEHDDAYRPS